MLPMISFTIIQTSNWSLYPLSIKRVYMCVLTCVCCEKTLKLMVRISRAADIWVQGDRDKVSNPSPSVLPKSPIQHFKHTQTHTHTHTHTHNTPHNTQHTQHTHTHTHTHTHNHNAHTHTHTHTRTRTHTHTHTNSSFTGA